MKGVGKTSLLRRAAGEGFSENYVPTIGQDCKHFRNMALGLQVWDFSGDPVFRDMQMGFFAKDTVALVSVFDLSRPYTLYALRSWMEFVRQTCTHPVCFAVVGAKLDRATESAATNPELMQLLFDFDALYAETSAKQDRGIHELFEALTRELRPPSLPEVRRAPAKAKSTSICRLL